MEGNHRFQNNAKTYLQLPLRQWGLPLSVVQLKGKHCRNPIAIMGLQIRCGYAMYP